MSIVKLSLHFNKNEAKTQYTLINTICFKKFTYIFKHVRRIFSDANILLN